MVSITEDELLKMANGSNGDYFAEKYSCWKKIDASDFEKLTFVGRLVSKDSKEFEYKTDTSYWAPDYPIALNYLPNVGCDIFVYNGYYFLVYMDFGGHAAEKRCRFLDKDLIVKPD